LNNNIALNNQLNALKSQLNSINQNTIDDKIIKEDEDKIKMNDFPKSKLEASKRNKKILK
jgi:hypothetical protein